MNILQKLSSIPYEKKLAFKHDIIVIVGGRLLVALAGLASLRVLTYYMSPEKYGELSLLVVIQSLCGLLLVNPVGQYLNVNTHQWYDQGTLFSRLASYRKYLFMVSVVGSGLVFLLLYNAIEDLFVSALALLVIVWVVNWNSTLVPLLNMLDKRIASVAWSAVTVILGMITSTLFIVHFESKASNWLFGQAVGMLVGIMGAKYSLRKFESTDKQEKRVLITKNEFITFCLPLAAATFFMWFSQSGYRIFVEYYWGLTALAFFVVGFQVAGALWSMVETIAMQFLHPCYYKASSDESNETKLQNALTDLINTLIPIYIFLCGMMLLGANQIFFLLVDVQYHSAIQFFYLAVIIEFVRVSTNVIGHAAQVKRKTKMLIAPYTIYAVMLLISVLISAFFKLKLGYFGFLILSASLFFLVLMHLCMKRLIAYDIKWIYVFFMILLLIFIGFFVFLINLKYELTFTYSLFSLSGLGVFTLIFIYLFLRVHSPLKRLLDEKIAKF